MRCIQIKKTPQGIVYKHHKQFEQYYRTNQVGYYIKLKYNMHFHIQAFHIIQIKYHVQFNNKYILKQDEQPSSNQLLNVVILLIYP